MMHCTSGTLLAGVFRPAMQRSSTLPPCFLIPSITNTQRASLSSSPSLQARKDGNPNRGVSALRRTGLRRGTLKSLVVRLENLPKPVLDPRKRSAVQVDEDHGLWEFFDPERNSLTTPMDVDAHGRAWTVPELRKKDWDDLWRLWWVCAKDKNRLSTFMLERERLGSLEGADEAKDRMKELKRTQLSIKAVLTERWYTWESARVLAMDDPEVNLYADPEQGEAAYLERPGTPAPSRRQVSNPATPSSAPLPPPLAKESKEPATIPA